MDSYFWLAQALGLVACLINCISFLIRRKSAFLLWQVGSNLAYGAQYCLLNAYAALLNNVISIIKLLFFYGNARRNKANPPFLVWMFSGLSVLAGLWVVDSWYALIPIVVALIYTYATWQDSVLLLKALVALCSLLWIIYNYMVRAYVALIYSLVEFSMALFAVLRLRKEQKNIAA